VFLITINKPKQLLHLSFIGRVRAEEIAQARENLAALLADLSPGFIMITDLDRVESFGVGCDREIGKNMELVDQRDVGLVIRVIPDPSKDIGLNILGAFHYAKHRRVVTCENIVEVAKFLPANSVKEEVRAKDAKGAK
jgi:hypothetical protein